MRKIETIIRKIKVALPVVVALFCLLSMFSIWMPGVIVSDHESVYLYNFEIILNLHYAKFDFFTLAEGYNGIQLLVVYLFLLFTLITSIVTFVFYLKKDEKYKKIATALYFVIFILTLLAVIFANVSPNKLINQGLGGDPYCVEKGKGLNFLNFCSIFSLVLASLLLISIVAEFVIKNREKFKSIFLKISEFFKKIKIEAEKRKMEKSHKAINKKTAPNKSSNNDICLSRYQSEMISASSEKILDSSKQNDVVIEAVFNLYSSIYKVLTVIFYIIAGIILVLGIVFGFITDSFSTFAIFLSLSVVLVLLGLFIIFLRKMYEKQSIVVTNKLIYAYRPSVFGSFNILLPLDQISSVYYSPNFFTNHLTILTTNGRINFNGIRNIKDISQVFKSIIINRLDSK